MLENIEYLPIKNQIKVGDTKNLAVTLANKDDMIKVYPAKTSSSAVSNADMLSQSFGGTTPVIESFKKEEPEQEKVQKPVEISSIPTTQNTYNMEANPVDLNINSSEKNGYANNSAFSSANEVNLNIPKLEDVSVTVPNANDTVLNGNTQNNNGIVNDFKVTNDKNIFDNPLSITEEEINKGANANNTNIFSQSTEINDKEVDETRNNVIPFPNDYEGNKDQTEVYDSLNDNFLMAQIEIEKNNVLHYQALADNSNKKIELLQKYIKSNKIENTNLENTASNLFNNNGSLNEEQVLGKTPMPFIKAA